MLTSNLKSPKIKIFCLAACSMFAIEFFLNVFTEFAEFNDKKNYILKRLFKLNTSYIRD